MKRREERSWGGKRALWGCDGRDGGERDRGAWRMDDWLGLEERGEVRKGELGVCFGVGGGVGVGVGGGVGVSVVGVPGVGGRRVLDKSRGGV